MLINRHCLSLAVCLLAAAVPVTPSAAAGDPVRVIGASVDGWASAPGESPGSPRRDIAIQDDGTIWIVDPTSRFVVVLSPDLTPTLMMPLDPTIPSATALAPEAGMVGIAAVPGDPGKADYVLVRAPRHGIGRVAFEDGLLRPVAPFLDVEGLPAGRPSTSRK